jgi:hypothetical protein
LYPSVHDAADFNSTYNITQARFSRERSLDFKNIDIADDI